MSNCKHNNRAVLASVCEDGLFVIKKQKSISGPSGFLLEVCVPCSVISPEAMVFVIKENVSPKCSSSQFIPFGSAGTAILLKNKDVTFCYDKEADQFYAHLPGCGLKSRMTEQAQISVSIRNKMENKNSKISALDVLRDSRFPKNEQDQIEMLRMSEEARIQLEKKVQRIRDKQNERNRTLRENGSSEKKRKIDDTTDNCFSDISDKEYRDNHLGFSEEEIKFMANVLGHNCSEEEEGIVMPKEEEEN